MIQRIQSLWLFLAALVSAGGFYFCDYKAHVVINNADSVINICATNNFLELILTLLITVLPLVIIFLFKNRKQQLGLIALTIIAIIATIADIIMRVANMNNKVPMPTDGHYSVGAVLPVIAIVFLILARNGVKNDERLVKSTDRLR